MSQQPYVVYQPVPARSNGLGIAGFIVSLVGLFSCGALSPIGLVLSSIAIFKRPRGFAFAGLILGVVGIISGIIALVCGLVGGAAALLGFGAIMPVITAETDMARIAHVALPNKAPDGTIPTDPATLPGLKNRQLTDPWGHAYRIVTTGPNSIEVISSGPDGIPDTSDDLHFEESNTITHEHRSLRHRSHRSDGVD